MCRARDCWPAQLRAGWLRPIPVRPQTGRPPMPAAPGNRAARPFVPLLLITLGLALFLGNFAPERVRAGLVLLGIGAAFVAARVASGRYGYAVPGGVLLALGAFALLEAARPSGAPARETRSLFFVVLGFGFLAVYALGARPWAVWPLFPGLVLLAVGLALGASAYTWPLAPFAWIGSYWPVVLVLVGVWLLFHDRVPRRLRRPITAVGVVLIVAYALVAAMAAVGTGVGRFAGAGAPILYG